MMLRVCLHPHGTSTTAALVSETVAGLLVPVDCQLTGTRNWRVDMGLRHSQ